MVNSEAPRRSMRWSWVLVLWGASLAAAGALAVVVTYQYHARLRLLVSDVKRALPGGEVREIPIQTGLYTLWSEEVVGPFEGIDGGIAAVGDGILVATRTGAVWYLPRGQATALDLSFQIPIDIAAFVDAVGHIPGVRPDTFGVKGIAVKQGEATFSLFAGYPTWDRGNACATYRVAQAEIPYSALAGAASAAEISWSTLYETQPCVSANITNGNFAGLQQAGGRLAVLDDEHLLLSVGDYYHDGLNGPSLPQAMNNAYGKTILISLNGDPARHYSSGHRNAQGLAIAANGDIFLTEHGPQGGDELNRIRRGADYGWPQVTHGTNYGMHEWPPSDKPGRHDEFERPVFAWMPSIGISNLISVQSPLFPHWQDDLLVASLTSRTLFRVHLAGTGAALVEPIRIQHRIRDITEAPDGSIVLKTDDNLIIFLRPVNSYERTTSGTDLVYGRMLAAQCSGCHALDASGERMGPTLAGLPGRRIASVDGYAYSESLTSLDGHWTPQLLRDFLRDPNAMAQGTTMLFAVSLTDQDVDDLMAYLATLD